MCQQRYEFMLGTLIVGGIRVLKTKGFVTIIIGLTALISCTPAPAATAIPIDVLGTAEAVMRSITPVPTATPVPTSTPATTAAPVDVLGTAEAIVRSITPVPTATPVPTTAAPVDVLGTAQAVMRSITPVPTATPAPTSTPAATAAPVDVLGTAQAVTRSITPVPTATPAPTSTPAATTAPVDVLGTAQAVVRSVTPVPTTTPVPTSTPAATATPLDVKTPADISEMIKRGERSVVPISDADWSGTGFVIDSEGHIFTAAHVIATPDSLQAYVGGIWRPATVIAVDERYDTAIIKVDPARPLEPLPIANGAEIGEDVFIVAHQFGAGSEISTTSGVVSGYPLINGVVVMQTDAAVNPGTSGAPVVNLDGEVISMVIGQGIDAYEELARGINYAVRHSDLTRIWDGRDALKPTPSSTSAPSPTVVPTPAATLIYGPVDHEEYSEAPPLTKIADGIIELTFRNPNSNRWVLSIVFRGRNDRYTYDLTVFSDRDVVLFHADWDGDNTRIVWQTTSRNVDTMRNGRNKVRVEMKGETGQLWINDQWIADLDLSDILDPDWVFVSGWNDDPYPSVEETRFEYLRIWKIN